MKLAVANARVAVDAAILQDLELRLAQDNNHEIRYQLVRWLDSRPGPPPDLLAKVWNDFLFILLDFFPERAEEGIATIQPLLHHTDLLFEQAMTLKANIRLQIAKLLRNTKYHTHALSTLIALLESHDTEVRLQAALALRNTDIAPQTVHFYPLAG